MCAAFSEVLDVLADEQVDLYVHAFGTGDVERTRSIAAAYANAPLLSAEEFIASGERR